MQIRIRWDHETPDQARVLEDLPMPDNDDLEQFVGMIRRWGVHLSGEDTVDGAEHVAGHVAGQFVTTRNGAWFEIIVYTDPV